MTDKVQKIREEVARLKLCTMDEHMKFYSESAEAEYNALCKVEEIIDSLQEEPVNNDFEMALAEMIDKAQKCVVEPLVVAAQWKDELIKLAKSEEPVSEELQERLPEIIKAVRYVRSLVARASIECRPERYTEDVKEWFKPFEEVQQALDYAEHQIRIKLREHE